MLTMLIALFAQPADFTSDPAEMSRLLQHSCQIQQVNNNGRGEPADYAPFCGCMDSNVMDEGGPAIHRIFALGGQGALQEQSMLSNWQAAQETARSEAAAMPEADQARFGPILQGSLQTCLSLLPMPN